LPGAARRRVVRFRVEHRLPLAVIFCPSGRGGRVRRRLDGRLGHLGRLGRVHC